ncbi:hypothetical protein HAX54_037006, partial [Datura stramonium]|nr:hypothetical protein [Datura stramonium]
WVIGRIYGLLVDPYAKGSTNYQNLPRTNEWIRRLIVRLYWSFVMVDGAGLEDNSKHIQESTSGPTNHWKNQWSVGGLL